MKPKFRRQIDNIKSLLKVARHEILIHEPNSKERDSYLKDIKYCKLELEDLWSLVHSNLYRKYKKEKEEKNTPPVLKKCFLPLVVAINDRQFNLEEFQHNSNEFDIRLNSSNKNTIEIIKIFKLKNSHRFKMRFEEQNTNTRSYINQEIVVNNIQEVIDKIKDLQK